ncbi:MAG TPA: 3-deoxy-D-manno-octulosonic acid transferase [Candidatus Udaeobacter sp.]|nr:3-deoxy-D-manno-octulosonic acid transferase [Candidatus Udaeobacter sp.]
MFYILYNTVLTIVFLITLPFLPVIALIGGRYRDGLGQRLGLYSKTDFRALAGSRPVWVHAASVGEVRSAASFINEIKRRLPATKVVLSTFTATGNRIAKDMNLADLVIFLPLDLRWIVRRVLAKIEPSALIIIETEIWPNLLRGAFKKGVPTLLLSGRLSGRALQKYRWLGGFFGKVARCFTAMGMQSQEDADRMVQLGAEANKIAITGSLKHMSASEEPIGSQIVQTQVRWGSYLLVVGSSHRGEEEILLEVFLSLKRQFPNLRLVLAPRHPQRFAEVEKLLRTTGLGFKKKSEVNGRVDFDKDVMFLDTLGDLRAFYAIGDIVFVGGSLVNGGGHNLLEPARFRKPVLFGPYMTNFASLAAELKRAGGGIEVRGAADLIRVISDLLNDPEKRKMIGEKAYAIAADDRGVLERSMGLVAPYL